MKALIVLSMLFTSIASASDTISLMEYKETFDKKVHEIKFEVNKNLKRAWVEVTLGESFSDEIYYDVFDIEVPGLSYDPELNGVVYDNGVTEVVCGTFYDRRWFPDSGMSFLESGNCKFESKRFVKVVDDGFRVRNVKMVEVILKIK